MPHSRSHSWAESDTRTALPSCCTAGQGSSYNSSNASPIDEKEDAKGHFYSTRSRRMARTMSIPAITNPEDYCPAPFSRPSTKMQRLNGKMDGPMKLALLPQLWVLPSMPGLCYNNPRNELQRRVSPTALSFSSSVTSTPPLTPRTPSSAHSFTTHREELFQKPRLTNKTDNSVYVLTLKTSDEIARHMQMLRQKWFPADKLKVPAHVTLFHALPGSRLATISQHIEQVARHMKRFQVSTGHIVKTKNGVLVKIEAGDQETRRIFYSLRTSCWEWLSDQDKSFQAHWTVQNKENDPTRVEQAYRDTHRLGAGLGWATGLVLWKYETDGRWTKQKEYEFAHNSWGRREEESESDSDGLPTY